MRPAAALTEEELSYSSFPEVVRILSPLLRGQWEESALRVWVSAPARPATPRPWFLDPAESADLPTRVRDRKT